MQPAATCSVVWNGDTDTFTDFGQGLTDADGTRVIREGNGKASSYGRVTFKWIFYAVVDEEYVPPKTGVEGVSRVMEIIVLAARAAVAVMIVVVAGKRGRRRSKGR